MATLSKINQHHVELFAYLKPGGHVIYDKSVPLTNLYVTLMGHMGVRPETIGDSNGQTGFLSDRFFERQVF
jgi:hypothetical protein